MSSQIPRLEFEELEQSLATVLSGRAQRLGYLGEFFRVMGHQPSALKGFVEFTEAAKAALDKRLVELLALTMATHFENTYEQYQHERLSVRLGFGRDWIRDVERLNPEAASTLTGLERQVQRFALLSAKTNGGSGQQELEDLVKVLGASRSVAVLMIVGRYISHAYIVKVLGLQPPVPSIWQDGYSG
jgi:hypothetical protein